MTVDLAGAAKVLPLVADQDRVLHPGIQFQLHFEPAQGQVDLVEIVVDADGPVCSKLLNPGGGGLFPCLPRGPISVPRRARLVEQQLCLGGLTNASKLA